MNWMTFFWLAMLALAVGSLMGGLAAVFAGWPSVSSQMVAVPGMATFQSRRVTDPNQSETIRQRLYDHLLYPAAGAQQLTFFSSQVGQGITTAPGATAGTPKTYSDTNLDSPSALPSGKSYLIETMEVYFYPGSVSTANTFTPAFSVTDATAALSATIVNSMRDTQAFYESGLLEFEVLDKVQLRETPLRSFPPKTWFDVSVALAAADTNTTTAIKLLAGHGRVDGRPYIMDPEISLQPTENFKVSLKWPNAYATPSGFNARVGVYFDGFLMRAAQ